MTIRNKFTLLLLIFSLLPVTAFTFIFIDQSRETLTEQIRRDLALTASVTEDYIETFLKDRGGRVSDWASDGHIKREVAALVLESTSSEDASIFFTESEKAQSLGVYLDKWKLPLDKTVVTTMIYARSGDLITSTLPPEERLLQETLSELTDSIEELNLMAGEFQIAPLSRHKAGADAEFHVIVPIVDIESEKPVGYMVNHISNNELNLLLLSIEDFKLSPRKTTTTRGSETIEMYLVNDEGYMLTPSRFVKNAVLEQRVDTLAVRNCHDLGIATTNIYTDYLGTSVLGASRCPENEWWMLLIEVDTDEIFASIDDLEQKMQILLFLLFLSIVLLSYLMHRKIKKTISSELSAIKEISNGNFKKRLDTSMKNEISEINASINLMSENLGKAFSQKTLAIKKLKKNEKILKENIEDLENFTRLTVGRELKMQELKEEIALLQKKEDGECVDEG